MWSQGCRQRTMTPVGQRPPLLEPAPCSTFGPKFSSRPITSTSKSTARSPPRTPCGRRPSGRLHLVERIEDTSRSRQARRKREAAQPARAPRSNAGSCCFVRSVPLLPIAFTHSAAVRRGLASRPGPATIAGLGRANEIPPLLAALLAFVAPGAGHVYASKARRGVAFLVALGLLFGLGVALHARLARPGSERPAEAHRWAAQVVSGGVRAPARPIAEPLGRPIDPATITRFRFTELLEPAQPAVVALGTADTAQGGGSEPSCAARRLLGPRLFRVRAVVAARRAGASSARSASKVFVAMVVGAGDLAGCWSRMSELRMR